MNLITLDFETYYDKDYSLSKLTTEEYIRDPRFEVIGVGVKVNDEPATWFTGTHRDIKDVLLTYDIQKHRLLAHNTLFDGAILHWHFGIKAKYYHDTLSMARPIHGSTVGGSLSKLVKHYQLGEKGTEVVNALGLRRHDFPKAQLIQYGEYCKNDVELTYQLFQKLAPETVATEMHIIDMMLRLFIDPVIMLDKQCLSEHLSTVVRRREQLEASLPGGDRRIVMSNPQFAKLLTDLGVEPPMKMSPRTGKLTFAFSKNDQDFKALLDHVDDRVQALVAARLGLKSTIEETRTVTLLGVADRGPLPVPLLYWGAHTGRASGGDKINLQNLPARGGQTALRDSILPPPGHVIIACDSSQIEARINAYFSGEVALVEAFRRGEDIYSQFASEVYGRPITKANKIERFVGKTCILGLGYSMSSTKLQTTLKNGNPSVEVDQREAIRMVSVYRNLYTQIRNMWYAADTGMREVINGRLFRFPSPAIPLLWSQDGLFLPTGTRIRYPNLRLVIVPGVQNHPPEAVYDNRYGSTKLYGGKIIENVVQALARQVVFEQMLTIHNHLNKYDGLVKGKRFRVVLTVHDEVVAIVPEESAERVRDMMVRVMSAPPVWAPELPVACEAAVGETYGACK